MKQRLRWKRGRLETFKQHKDLFFSTKPYHNKLLTWLILPLAVFGDIQLAFELLFVLVLYIFSFVSHDFSAFVSGILVVSLMFFIQLFDDRQNKKPTYLLLAPIGWLLFYLSTRVEFNALFKSIWGKRSSSGKNGRGKVRLSCKKPGLLTMSTSRSRPN